MCLEQVWWTCAPVSLCPCVPADSTSFEFSLLIGGFAGEATVEAGCIGCAGPAGSGDSLEVSDFGRDVLVGMEAGTPCMFSCKLLISRCVVFSLRTLGTPSSSFSYSHALKLHNY